MQPTFILTRTFAICGLLVGAASLAQAAPVRASPRGDVQIRDPVPFFPTFVTDAIATVADTVKRSAYLGACGAGCLRESEVEVKRAPEPKPWMGACFMGCKRTPKAQPEPEPVPAPEPTSFLKRWIGACAFGCKREPSPEPAPQPKTRRWMGACFMGCKREPKPEPQPAPEPKPWMGACFMGCKRAPEPKPAPEPEPAPAPFMGACRMGCKRGVEERKDILDETLEVFKPEAHAPLDVLAREPLA